MTEDSNQQNLSTDDYIDKESGIIAGGPLSTHTINACHYNSAEADLKQAILHRNLYGLSATFFTAVTALGVFSEPQPNTATALFAIVALPTIGMGIYSHFKANKHERTLRVLGKKERTPPIGEIVTLGLSGPIPEEP